MSRSMRASSISSDAGDLDHERRESTADAVHRSMYRVANLGRTQHTHRTGPVASRIYACEGGGERSS